MIMQIDKLIAVLQEKNNPTVLGLDSRFSYVPENFARKYASSSEAVFAFNAVLLEELQEIIGAVKIQAAYYELLGTDGIVCMQKTAQLAASFGYSVIIDAKRGDIGATAAAYSGAYLAQDAPFKADFLTVNPYLGSDGILPFVEDAQKTGRGIFVLVKTSNPSSSEFQDILVENLTGEKEPLFVMVGKKVAEWGKSCIGTQGYSSVGAVIGATWSKQIVSLRRKMPHTFFLLPGYGTQGASGKELVGAFDDKGRGAAVAASRSLICAHLKLGTDDFATAAREAALAMRTDLRCSLERK